MSEPSRDETEDATLLAFLSATRVRVFSEEGRPASEVAEHARAASARYATLAAMLDGSEPRVLRLASAVTL
jgi:hypothetical protein